jgi:thiol-disulfide isomerase/thioredoxin
MNFKLIILSITILFFASCSKNNSFQISGKIDNASGKTLYISEITGKGIELIDSIKISDNGEFNYELESSEIKFIFLKMDGKINNFITLIVDATNKITITADANELAKTYKVRGSENSELAYQLNKKLIESSSKIDSLTQIYNFNKGKDGFDSLEVKLNKSYEDVALQHRKYIIEFIDKNTSSLASILALYQSLNRNKVLNQDTDIEHFKKVSEALTKKYPDSKHTKILNQNLLELSRAKSEKNFKNLNIAIGEIAPDITLPTPEGNKFSLSSLKGKIVLLDFWASWCGPCRNENPSLVAAYKKYNSKGFEILQVSLDKTHADWVEAIKNDNLTWKHISDLMFWNSDAAKLYKVQSIPSNFLIDKDGKIIAKDLRGEDLAKKLSEILK